MFIFYAHERPFMHCLYFICERNFYARTHVKITRHWISTLNRGLKQLATTKATDTKVCTEVQEKKKKVVVLFTSSTKREIKPFYVVVVQWRQRNAQKKRDARSHCRLHRHYLSSLFTLKYCLNWSRKVKIRHFQTCRHNWRVPKTELAVRNLLETAFHSWPSSLQATLTSLSIWAAAELSAVSEEDKIRCDFNGSYH